MAVQFRFTYAPAVQVHQRANGSHECYISFFFLVCGSCTEDFGNTEGGGEESGEDVISGLCRSGFLRAEGRPFLGQGKLVLEGELVKGHAEDGA